MNKEFFEGLRKQGITHVGLAWFEPETYQQVVSVMKDRDRLYPTHVEWLQAASKMEEAMRREDFVPVRAVLRADEFVAHCRRHGLQVDSNGRNHFASFIAAQVQRDGMSR